MNARKRRLAKRRRAAVKIDIGRGRLWKHYLRKGYFCFLDQLSSYEPEAYARSPWGYQVRLW
jgi:hypothetical protein